ncbi:hypothetical protein [Streptomyces sp. WZ-12]|uniref:hypothetical protein n=1 Tax=Streptomyces sp. WZ-12 TaxID=3030210 RepID=UPI0023810791|nr:hypothetical protein [Streptomyces sp. WZ-12]
MSEKSYMDVVDPWLRQRVEAIQELVEKVDLPHFDAQAAEIEMLWKDVCSYEETRRMRREAQRKPRLAALTVNQLAEMLKEMSSGPWPSRKGALMAAVLEMEWHSNVVWKAYQDARQSYHQFDSWRAALKQLPSQLQDLEDEAAGIVGRLEGESSSESVYNMKRYGMSSMVSLYLAEAAVSARLAYQEGGYYPAVIELINQARRMLFFTSASRMEVSLDGASEVAKLFAARELLRLVSRWVPPAMRVYVPAP